MSLKEYPYKAKLIKRLIEQEEKEQFPNEPIDFRYNIERSSRHRFASAGLHRNVSNLVIRTNSNIDFEVDDIVEFMDGAKFRISDIDIVAEDRQIGIRRNPRAIKYLELG